MPKEPLMAFDHNPEVGRYGFRLDKSNISRGPAIAKDKQMPRTPRIALDDALEPGQQIAPTMTAKLMSYLETVLDQDQLADVTLLLKGEETDSNTPAMDRAMKRHADNAKRRQESSRDYAAMFPHANRLKY